MAVLQGLRDAGVREVVLAPGSRSTPLALAAPHLASGRLVELPPARRIAVPLYWQRTRLAARLLDRLTQAVLAAGRSDD